MDLRAGQPCAAWFSAEGRKLAVPPGFYKRWKRQSVREPVRFAPPQLGKPISPRATMVSKLGKLTASPTATAQTPAPTGVVARLSHHETRLRTRDRVRHHREWRRECRCCGRIDRAGAALH